VAAGAKGDLLNGGSGSIDTTLVLLIVAVRRRGGNGGLCGERLPFTLQGCLLLPAAAHWIGDVLSSSLGEDSSTVTGRCGGGGSGGRCDNDGR
jgi:hypothetical protein